LARAASVGVSPSLEMTIGGFRARCPLELRGALGDERIEIDRRAVEGLRQLVEAQAPHVAGIAELAARRQHVARSQHLRPDAPQDLNNHELRVLAEPQPDARYANEPPDDASADEAEGAARRCRDQVASRGFAGFHLGLVLADLTTSVNRRSCLQGRHRPECCEPSKAN
jgi:hypothetical protein